MTESTEQNMDMKTKLVAVAAGATLTAALFVVVIGAMMLSPTTDDCDTPARTCDEVAQVTGPTVVDYSGEQDVSWGRVDIDNSSGDGMVVVMWGVDCNPDWAEETGVVTVRENQTEELDYQPPESIEEVCTGDER
ncbi:hypothetical protein ACFPYI_13725 [Halomarina salina]|uniref:Uncharacterized protein n=1 Tax=Halomarina salina TaxID=1872699 RepID=A0ABD5RPC6_9EURY|nr:hypothetical protein [Halomarina salina]